MSESTALAERPADRLPETQREPVSILNIIARAASDPNTDVDKLERLMAMSERVRAKDAEQAFNAAMTAAQGEMGRISADATNPQTRSKYASYAALDRAVRPIYTRHGFALSFDTGADATPDHVRVLCHVSHKDGHARTYQVDMPADGKGAKGGDVMTKTHAVGAAMSYGSRYLLKLIFNVAVGEDDDDGNGAADNGAPITNDQFATITELMDKAGADPEKFCAHMKVGAIREITQRRYPDAIRALNTKLHKKPVKEAE